MTYEDFLAVGLRLQKQDMVRSELMKLGVDVLDLCGPYDEIVNILIKEVYGEQGADWFSWFCYESDFGTKDWNGAQDENGNPICYDWESLYNCLEQL
jgi:hypothetical protein